MLDPPAQALRDNATFVQDYLNIVTLPATKEKVASHAGVQRRSLIRATLSKNGYKGDLGMVTLTQIEKQLNTELNLCPYGLTETKREGMKIPEEYRQFSYYKSPKMQRALDALMPEHLNAHDIARFNKCVSHSNWKNAKFDTATHAVLDLFASAQDIAPSVNATEAFGKALNTDANLLEDGVLALHDRLESLGHPLHSYALSAYLYDLLPLGTNSDAKLRAILHKLTFRYNRSLPYDCEEIATVLKEFLQEKTYTHVPGFQLSSRQYNVAYDSLVRDVREPKHAAVVEQNFRLVFDWLHRQRQYTVQEFQEAFRNSLRLTDAQVEQFLRCLSQSIAFDKDPADDFLAAAPLGTYVDKFTLCPSFCYDAATLEEHQLRDLVDKYAKRLDIRADALQFRILVGVIKKVREKLASKGAEPAAKPDSADAAAKPEAERKYYMPRGLGGSLHFHMLYNNLISGEGGSITELNKPFHAVHSWLAEKREVTLSEFRTKFPYNKDNSRVFLEGLAKPQVHLTDAEVDAQLDIYAELVGKLPGALTESAVFCHYALTCSDGSIPRVVLTHVARAGLDLGIASASANLNNAVAVVQQARHRLAEKQLEPNSKTATQVLDEKQAQKTPDWAVGGSIIGTTDSQTWAELKAQLDSSSDLYMLIEKARHALAYEARGSVTLQLNGGALVAPNGIKFTAKFPEEAAMAFQSSVVDIPTTPSKGNTMSSINTKSAVSTVTYIYDVPADQVTDAQVWGHIARLEAEISQLASIQNRPESLKAHVKNLQGQIDALIQHVDGVLGTQPSTQPAPKARVRK